MQTEPMAGHAGEGGPEGLFTRVFRSAPFPLLVVEAASGKILGANDRYGDFAGRPAAELVGRTTKELGMWVDASARERIYADIEAHGAVRGREVQIRDHTGAVRIGRFSGGTVELGGRLCIVTTFEDLTEHKRVEAALRESEGRFSKAFYASPDPYIIAEAGTNHMIDVNEAYCRLFGVTREEAIGHNNSELGLWADLAQRDHFVEMLTRTGEVHEMEQRRRKRSGEAVICRVSGFKVDIGGRACTLYRIRDITHERQAEQALRDSEEKFAKAFHAAPDAISITTVGDGRFIEVNEGFTRIVGWTREEAVGRTSLELGIWVHEAERAGIVAQLRAGARVHEAPVSQRDKAGRLHRCLFTAEPIDIAGEPCLLAVVRDVTERQRLEDQLRHAQKMESVGQLAGGVAHDFNNLLTVIQGHASFLLQGAALEAPARDSLRQIQESAALAAQLTRQLLVFSRRQAIQPGRLALPGAVARMMQLLERVLGENLVLEVALPPGLPDVQADAGMVEQVLLNLVVNARDAMPLGGRIVIAARELTAGPDYVRRVPQARPGRFVGLGVRDHGEGIAPEVLPRIFDPFFTTKKEGKGTGLGLATVYSITEQHGGWIEVDSQPGRGSEFTVWFPVATAVTRPPLPEPAPPAEVHGTETILVVEDKDAVRMVLQAVLERFGYQVVLAQDGPDALARWAEHRERIALLFTDVMMPGGLTGKDLADRLRADRPDLKVVFCSGYDANILDAEALQAAGTRFLTKPFDLARLTQVVREVLDAH